VSDLFDAKPIPGAPFGIELEADLSRAFGNAEKGALRNLFAQDGLLLFRNQSLTMDQQLDASEIFGPVMRGAMDNYLISNVEEEGLLGDGELLFHVDIPFVPAPYLGGSLQALDVESGVSATRFASAFRAWEQLPEDLQRRIDGKTVLHVRGRELGRRTMLSDSQPGDNCAVHSLVGQQEGTGRPYLFACMDMAALIIGLSEPGSDALLEELFGHLYATENIYEHHWQNGDLIVWNNRAIQHARSPIEKGRRTLQRVAIAELGYWDQCPADLKTFDDLQRVKNKAA
jgi:taurine dioxygenase